ncbi:futalosine hydrolase [Allorhizocola rhizosphaerae]|uniref:futalosine hydrolase n=1 Tax=Allorhizocola rhizosphaerae TaxID=1872709 RepID=UPI000E3D1B2E|nr:futalosine hydrolase [Allorhizocola rhizosphaerae]
MSLLIVTAVPAEAEAVRKGLPSDSPIMVAPVGVGMAAAAAGTARLLTLADGRYTGVISFGIGGGLGVPLGGIVLAVRSIAADLGAESPEGFISLDDLGFGGSATIPADPGLLTVLRGSIAEAVVGDVVTVNTVTGTSERTAWMIERYPNAIAEGMEGYGVAVAATQADIPFAELRTISNLVGPRDRSAWQIGGALDALTKAAQLLSTTLSS